VRLNAADIIRCEELMLDDAETVVVAFGCTSRSARQAVREARSQGKKWGLLRLISVWPFAEARIRELLEQGNVKRFVVPEVNLGQLRREVERLTQLPIVRINHAGGEMPTPERILEAAG
jgi:2-oxoglutarate ferredoxin oxidoreductase subunit alpha